MARTEQVPQSHSRSRDTYQVAHVVRNEHTSRAEFPSPPPSPGVTLGQFKDPCFATRSGGNDSTTIESDGGSGSRPGDADLCLQELDIHPATYRAAPSGPVLN